MASAPASCLTGIGCVANAAVGTYSLDATYAGAQRLVSGNPTDTFLNQGLQSLGLSPQAAAYAEMALGLGAAYASTAALNKAIDQAVKLNVATREANKTSIGENGAKGTANNFINDALLPDADFIGRGTVRSDLTNHLVDATTSGKQISGGHDLNNFTTALNNAGGTVVAQVAKAPGIYEVQYQLPNATKSATKTVYDPATYPNMPDMANTAANTALTQYQITGDISQTVVVNGVKFSVPIRMQNGQPYVPTAFPVGVLK